MTSGSGKDSGKGKQALGTRLSHAARDRKLTQGAVRLNGAKITDPQAIQQAELRRGESYLLQIGRHAHRLVVR
jgi:ABC-type transporter Mla maintaining outer membrane lipid asymmetry ATPase subunit MlaF